MSDLGELSMLIELCRRFEREGLEFIDLHPLPDSADVRFCFDDVSHQFPKVSVIREPSPGVLHLLLARNARVIGLPIRCGKAVHDAEGKLMMMDSVGRNWRWEPERRFPGTKPLGAGAKLRTKAYWLQVGLDDDPTAPAYELVAKRDNMGPVQRWANMSFGSMSC